MCSICMTSIALMATGGSTAGGLAALDAVWVQKKHKHPVREIGTER